MGRAFEIGEKVALSSGKVGDEKNGSVILEVGDINFDDFKAVVSEVEGFAKKYALADTEYALAITVSGKKYIIRGQQKVVDPSVIGGELLKDSIGIHNHPLIVGGDSYDSFSINDLMFAAGHQQGKQYLVSGTRRNAFEFTEKYTPAQVEDAWNKALNDMWQKHYVAETIVVWEQEETLRELSKYLKGFCFYENF